MSARTIPANLARMAANVAETAERNAKASRGGDSPLAGPVYTADRIALPRKMRKGGGSPSVCWHCLRQLQRAPGKGLGLFYFNVVRDRGGAEHRVHGDCTSMAIRDGATLVPEVRS